MCTGASLRASNTASACSISSELISTRPVHHLFISIGEHGIWKTVGYGCGKHPIGFCKKKRNLQKKGTKVPYLFTSVIKWKENRRKLLVLHENHRSSLLCNVHLVQQIVVLMMPLTLVPPLRSKLLCLKLLPICDGHFPAKIYSYLELGKIHLKYVILMQVQSVHCMPSLCFYTKALILFSSASDL